jgi:uncharacterized protein (TIGR02599 family)
MPFRLPQFRLPRSKPGLRHAGDLTRGFTLLEVLAAAALLLLILAMTGAVVNSSSNVWRQANAKIETFQKAREVFEVMTGHLAKATLNTYWDYYDANFTAFSSANPAAVSNFDPKYYGRNSDLHFQCGRASKLLPQLPANLQETSTHAVFFVSPTGLAADPSHSGLSGLLSACGYFVAFGDDSAYKPGIVPTPPRHRWRLMEVTEPVEDLKVFSASGSSWFQNAVAQGRVRPVAENVIALIAWPRLPPQDDPDGTRISADYTYDSRTQAAWQGAPPRQPVQAHQLPPNLQVTLVALDEVSAGRLENGDTPPEEITAALAGLFEDVSKYEEDLNTLKTRLADKHIGFRIFSAILSLKESKWTES